MILNFFFLCFVFISLSRMCVFILTIGIYMEEWEEIYRDHSLNKKEDIILPISLVTCMCKRQTLILNAVIVNQFNLLPFSAFDTHHWKCDIVILKCDIVIFDV
jgi:hypothetical protein